jgi:hypothetical protein
MAARLSAHSSPLFLETMESSVRAIMPRRYGPGVTLNPERNKRPMRKTCYLMILSTALVISAFGANFSGKLLDASCYDKQQSATGCDANGSTTSFGRVKK